MEYISIIIPYYNAGDYIGRALKFAKSQKDICSEIIVIDDGSNDHNSNLLKAYSKEIDLLIVQRNKGQGAARNRGISKSKYDYILNWDADDYFESDFCKKAIQVIKNDNNVKLVTSIGNRTDGKKYSERIIPAGGTLNNFLFDNQAFGSVLFRKLDWRTVDGYDEAPELRGFEDWEFYIRLLKEGGIAYVLHECLFTYFRHSESTTSKIKDTRYDKRLYIYKKHQELYKSNFSSLMEDTFKRLEGERKSRSKIIEGIDFRVGRFILKPIRLIKSLFN
ncbi:glycosyltransferase family 2 protein [Leeuwenhoekiella sp. MAR_2009_132]|uniref:glycosyltransferase family 2 protein n=1 Tax=Leeuwenhoekiella sp. MAR_2009_132 TaxID=1392489 RepID=UPI00048FA4BA|nr:glycosyltransferase [Leeuwenhoekiella sp. MAR_2009_132]